MLAPGQKLGRYRLREPLGSGGMSAVYRAYDPVLDREVALKILPPELAHDATFRERFNEEARAMGRVEHPNLVRIYAVGQEGSVSFYAMELVNGRSLRQVMGSVERFTPDEALAVIVQVLRGLEAVHQAGVVHRDIKPGNIMLDTSGRAMLMDFGLARRADRQSMTMAGQVLGTPEYMSPEQARGDKADERSDLYSIGIVLYEMMGGRPPFGGKDTIAILRRHVETAVPPLHDQAPMTPPAIERIVARLLAKKPEERYPHVKELLADLSGASPPGLKLEKTIQDILAKSAQKVSRPTRTAVIDSPIEPAEEKAAMSAPSPKRDRIGTWVTVISAAVAVLALLTAVAALIRGRVSERATGSPLPATAARAPSPSAPRAEAVWKGEVILRNGDTFVGELRNVRTDAEGRTVLLFRREPDGRIERLYGSSIRSMKQKGGDNP